ncbi:MAG: DUF6798 domain-containing protein [Mariniblastus sp.]
MVSNLRWPLISFQINRGEQPSTEEPFANSGFESNLTSDGGEPHSGSSRRETVSMILETLLIFLVFALFSGQLPPDVNESHYLTKAKHFWNPDWCSGDIFLSSSFAHLVFYISFGWLTKFFSLSAVAWIGRVITWALLAYAWRRLSYKLTPSRWAAVVSAIFFLILNERFHLAGEWVVGGFEAKGIAYFFVLMALGSAVSNDWRWCWPALGAAMAFHVLVGGWALLCLMFAWIALRWIDFVRDFAGGTRTKFAIGKFSDQLKPQLIPLIAGAAVGLVGAIPPLLADSAVAPEIATEAQMIYVNSRISHHLTFNTFPTLHVARFVLVMLFWYTLSRWLVSRKLTVTRRISPLYFFCLASLGISLGGLVLSGLAEQDEKSAKWAAGLLRFYWFRLSDFAIPAGASLATVATVWNWMEREKRLVPRMSCWLFLGCLIVAGGIMAFEKHEDARPRADRRSLPNYEEDSNRTMDTYRNWNKVCDWISKNTREDATFITPDQQQTFKWYAGRSEIVCWKDIPQDAAGIIEWRQRLLEIYEPQRRYDMGLMSYDDEQLREMAKRYGATHLLIPQRQVDLAAVPTNLKQIYPEDKNSKSTYVVLEF